MSQDWLDKVRNVCTNVKAPREGKKEYIGQTFRDVTYEVSDKKVRCFFDINILS